MQNLNFKVDKEKCVKCGLCVKDCSSKVIKIGEDGFPYAEADACFGCQHCLSICPSGAIFVFDKNSDNSVLNENLPSAEQMANLIKNRRSCRQYKRENVDEAIMSKLKDILNWVPTGCNFKDLHFSFVENYEQLDLIKNKVYSKLKFMLKFFPLKGRLSVYKNAILSGEDMIFRNAPHMVVVSVNKNAPCKDIDPIIALSYFELYAQSLGLGTLWCGLAFKTLPLTKDVMKLLNIPKSHQMAYVMLFGYPSIEYKRAIQPDKYNICEIK